MSRVSGSWAFREHAEAATIAARRAMGSRGV
jgi:hypothetical protein